MIRAFESLRWSHLSLRRRLLLILWGTILLVLSGQIAVSISGEVASLDQRVDSHGAILAQAIATMCVDLMDGEDPRRFDEVIEQVERRTDLVELAITSRTGEIIGHTEHDRVGQRMVENSAFTPGRENPGVTSLFRGYTEHRASALVTRGRLVLGRVFLRFRSTELRERAVRLIASAVAVGAFWMLLGAVFGTIYVRKITTPLASLTDAANALREDRLDEVRLDADGRGDEVGVLQSTFGQLVTWLRAERLKNANLLEQLQQLNAGLRERVEKMTSSLRENNAYLESVLRCIHEGIITCDLDGNIVRANRGAYRQLDGLRAPSPGRNLSDLLAGGAAIAAAAGQAATGATQRLAGVEPVDGGPRDRHGHGGNARTLIFQLSPLLGPDDAPMGSVVTVVDETQQRTVEAQLRRHDRLISLGTIAAGLAHEMGNYIHTINGYSSLILRSLPSDDSNRGDVQAIRDESGRAIALLQRFLQFARPQEVRYHDEPMDLLVREALAMAAYQVRKAGVEVIDELQPDLPRTRCDGQLMKQVFVNIILNAIDAMEEAAQRRLWLRSRVADEEHVEIQISDSGEGIDPANLDHIFDPFFTTKAAKGTGLGLSIAHQIIVLRHEGTITAQSNRGEGATFTVVLPIAGPGSKPS